LLNLNCPEAPLRPLIRKFTDAITPVTGSGILDFKQLQSRELCLFWPNILIYRREPKLNDYRIIFTGTTTCTTYNKDWTGTLMSEMSFGPALKELHKLNDQVLKTGKRYFLSGIHDWKDKEFVKWWQVRMPLKRGEICNEVLLCLDFEHQKDGM